MGIKEFFLNKAQKANKRVAGLTSFEKSKSYGLLISGKNETSTAEKIENLLRNEGKAVEKIIYTPSKRQEETSPIANHAKATNLYKDDFNFLKLPKTERCKDWLKENYDYLILCGEEQYSSKESLLALSVAKCKIGKADSVLSKHLDLIIEGSDDYPQTILNTLKQIR